MEISLSSYLLNEFRKNKINVIFCDEKHNPSTQLLSLNGCFDSSRKVFKQIEWLNKNRIKVWKKVLYNKLYNQCDLLRIEGISNTDLIEIIKSSDLDDIEGIIAKMYFAKLFGKGFNRRVDNDINTMLNYGYSIIVSIINRSIVSLGYLTAIGIKHRNETNHYNFTYDAIEPFRPFVDKIVYENECSIFDNEIRRKLLEVVYSDCIYKNKKSKIIFVIPQYIKDLVDSIETGKNIIGRIELV